jgi:GNAT superfamily N-acetyltransferase
MNIQPYHPRYLPELQRLVNHHISAVLPGWALPATYIERHLERNPHQNFIDRWVAERKTLIALEQERVVAAVHMLRYRAAGETSADYRGACDVAWLLASNWHTQAAGKLLAAAVEQCDAWQATSVFAWDSHLPTPLIFGIPDVWPHLAQVFTHAGFEPHPERNEALYGGWLRDVPAPAPAPLVGLVLKRAAGDIWGVRFSAQLDGDEIAFCECMSDLTEGGDVPRLQGWAVLGEIFTHEAYRNRGVGRWLLQSAVEWLRLAGCDRVALSCAADDEQAGAGRFYRRFGWDVFTKIQDSWQLKR